MLDEGHLTDSLGRKINFKNCLIIMTSNIGVKKLQDFGTGIGFSNSYSTEEQKKEILKKELKNYFSPEFLNRIDDTIVFNSLKEDEIKKIVEIELNKLTKRLSEIKLNFKFDNKLVSILQKLDLMKLMALVQSKEQFKTKLKIWFQKKFLMGLCWRKNNTPCQSRVIKL